MNVRNAYIVFTNPGSVIKSSVNNGTEDTNLMTVSSTCRTIVYRSLRWGRATLRVVQRLVCTIASICQKM